MHSILPEVEELIKYDFSEKDTRILEAILETGTIKKAATALGYGRRTIQYRLAKMRKQAANHGYQPFFPSTSTVTHLPMNGQSIYQKVEGREDGVTAIWHKTKARDVHTAEILGNYIEGLHLKPRKKSKPLPKQKTRDLLPVLCLADCHLGLLAHEGETGQEWGMADSEELLIHAIDTLVEKMPRVKRALLVDAGDMTHSDGLIPTTPKSGNQLEVSHRYYDIARVAGQICRYAIEALLTKADYVDVVKARGNHDQITAWHVNEGLRNLYAEDPRVHVEPNEQPHIPYVWKDNFFVVTHGDAANNRQAYEFITTKWKQEHGQANHTRVFQGHVHHTRQEAVGDVLFETLNTLTVSDAYHEFKMYKSKRGMNLILFHPEGGEDSRYSFTPRW